VLLAITSEPTMQTSRRAALLLLLANTSVWSQLASDLPPPPPLEPPMPMPDNYGVAPGTSAIQLPHRGALASPPTSAASTRNTTLPTVTIKEFRSSVSEVTARGATDMFIAALVKTRKFRVLERARISEGIAAEKALSQQGMTTGQVGQSQYIGAAYYFEATISEASASDRTSSFTFGMAGAAAGHGTSTDSLAIDVRLTDVESGVVVDAVTVRKEIQSVQTKVAGVTSALANFFTKGRGGAVAEALTPNEQYASARKDSVDKTLREAIEEAVREIAKRFVNE
jgi:curli biogenesis system outer membrane secretion channel CsgG